MAWWHWVDVALGVAGLGIFAGLAWVLWGPQFTTQVEHLRIGPRRLAALVVLCSLGSTLWIGSPGWLGAVPLLPDADLSWRLVAYGLLVPWGVGLITLAFMEFRIALDLKRVEHRPLPEHDQVGVR